MLSMLVELFACYALIAHFRQHISKWFLRIDKIDKYEFFLLIKSNIRIFLCAGFIVRLSNLLSVRYAMD